MPLSLFDQLRARRELLLANSIRYKLAKAKLVLRPTEKAMFFILVLQLIMNEKQ
jgi:hypothetical protein